jgi:hypothetical protein
VRPRPLNGVPRRPPVDPWNTFSVSDFPQFTYAVHRQSRTRHCACEPPRSAGARTSSALLAMKGHRKLCTQAMTHGRSSSSAPVHRSPHLPRAARAPTTRGQGQRPESHVGPGPSRAAVSPGASNQIRSTPPIVGAPHRASADFSPCHGAAAMNSRYDRRRRQHRPGRASDDRRAASTSPPF